MEKTLKAPKIKIEKNIPLPKYTKMAQEDNLVDDLKKMQPMIKVVLIGDLGVN